MSSSSSTSNYEMKSEDFEYLQTLPGNRVCVDCGVAKPDWGTPTYGILFCFKCSGMHRGLGTHISFVRSITMDAWTPPQVERMKAGGNDRCNEFLQRHGVSSTSSIREKYDSPAAELYKEALKARTEGRPEPTELPKKVVPKKSPQKKKMEGFGSSPPPSSGKSSLTIILSVVSLVVAAASW
eukprot:CAMPEP_0198287242 /NCGR_PEP_ID=MMETSP1449-20131203/6132_1 /TAXON_ID=420275 /ORGANISM="Attheya septentrionalis, Strain CCMP2084" /LENGTH=181 /DNA_ID=CAMNT_0043985175 /DNA_START=268 /DNA_END=810 /DNA_ORIENTATION=+